MYTMPVLHVVMLCMPFRLRACKCPSVVDVYSMRRCVHCGGKYIYIYIYIYICISSIQE